MAENDLQVEYLEWMYQFVRDNRHYEKSYRKLFDILYEIDFVYNIPMDSNREEDGIDLRYRFGYEHCIDETIIKKYLDCRPCSVLEMMVALSIRCEEHIMDDPDVGDRTGKWFWGMISNMNLDQMDDEHFRAIRVKNIVYKVLNREYKSNGEGGFFTVKHSRYDLRTVEIWYQMCWYLNDIL